MAEHNTLTDPELHEPKGVASANDNEVYLANGFGSGVWTEITTQIPLVISGVIDDVSTAQTVYVPIPFAGTLTKLTTVIGGVIGTSDDVITPKNSAGSAMQTLTMTQSGSAAGDVDTVALSTNNTVTDDDYITIETDGASTNTVKCYFSFVLERT